MLVSGRYWMFAVAALMVVLGGCSAAPRDSTASKGSTNATEARPAVDQSLGGDPAEGRQSFLTRGCIACHQAQGIREATGSLGPSLTGLASRPTIAGALPNTPENLRAWLIDPHAYKPGTMMPDLDLTEREATDLVAFLETLK